MPQPIAVVDADLFWSRVRRSGGCWTWTHRLNDGYGEHRQGRSYWRAHRVAYELIVGPIPEGLVLDHLCRNRACVNPSHLEPVTNAENIRRGETGLARGLQRRAQTHCVHGHEFTPENTYWRRGKWRQCRACAAARRERWAERRTA